VLWRHALGEALAGKAGKAGDPACRQPIEKSVSGMSVRAFSESAIQFRLNPWLYARSRACQRAAMADEVIAMFDPTALDPRSERRGTRDGLGLCGS
jgi:hypothetical protein